MRHRILLHASFPSLSCLTRAHPAPTLSCLHAPPHPLLSVCEGWAHGAASALADRVKIARGGSAGGNAIDINLAVQHILNCGNVGSCHGGSVDGPYQWIQQISKATGTGISYETSNPYMACSSESTEG